MQTVEPVVSFRGVVKQLGGTLAVAGVDLDIAPGEIHALLGANGAGKSTLIKLLAGVHEPDKGTISFKGQLISGRDAEKLPITFIHQDLGLFAWMTVAENIAMVRGYSRRFGLIDWGRIEQQAAEALHILGSEIRPDAALSSLSRTEKSIVAIARALAVNSDVLVLDEPTASLPEAEVARLFDVLRRLRARNVGMIYVTHRLDEVFRLADHVTVLRDGHKVASMPVKDTTPGELVYQIVGRPPSELFLKPPPSTTQPLLEITDIRVGTVGPVSLKVMAGEILGLCGLMGAGHEAIGRAICGILPIAGGSILLQGKPVSLTTPGYAVHRGIMFVSSKRDEESLCTGLSVKENLFLNPAARGRRFFSPMRRSEESARADVLVREFSIQPPDPDRVVSTLSGGNQQKVVLARWLGAGSRVLVLEEPTQGVDVGAKREIYAMLDKTLDKGHAVVMVSSDLEEVAGVCSRALIFNRGAISAELSRPEMSLNKLISLVGNAPDEAAS